MYDLERKREQHDAALTYLDTGTLALAEILAAIDDGPAEEATPNVTRKPGCHRRTRRVARWSAGAVTLTASGVVGALFLAPSASACSPFDNPVYRAVDASSNWQCAATSHLEQSCVSLDGTARSDVVAEEGSDETTYATTITRAGKVSRTEITVFDIDNDEAADVANLRSAMHSNPTAYPNEHEGAGWMLWSTDTDSADKATTALKARSTTAHAPRHAAKPRATPSATPEATPAPKHAAKPHVTPSTRAKATPRPSHAPKHATRSARPKGALRPHLAEAA